MTKIHRFPLAGAGVKPPLNSVLNEALMAQVNGTRSSRSARSTSVFGLESASNRPLPHPDTPEDEAQDQAPLRHALLPMHINPEYRWRNLSEFALDPTVVERSHLITQHAGDAVGLLHDHLRTRVLQAMTERDWTRLAICSPTRNCGSSTLAANLALSLARRPSGRTVILDLNLRNPGLARMFGQRRSGPIRKMLTGEPFEQHLQRYGRTLAIGFNDTVEAFSAELLQEPSTALAMASIQQDLEPDLMIFDLPPVLESDDTLAMLPLVDAVLLVVDGTRTTAAEVAETERLLKEHTEILGVVMNRAEDQPATRARRR